VRCTESDIDHSWCGRTDHGLSSGIDQRLFLRSTELFNFNFTFAGTATAMSILSVHDCQWRSSVEIFGAAGFAGMFLESTLDIGADTRVKSTVVGLDYIDNPIAGFFIVSSF